MLRKLLGGQRTTLIISKMEVVFSQRGKKLYNYNNFTFKFDRSLIVLRLFYGMSMLSPDEVEDFLVLTEQQIVVNLFINILTTSFTLNIPIYLILLT